jgi:hypothetical protein
MIAILCHPGDEAALWLDRTWHGLGIEAIELISVEQLAFSRHIVHRLDTAGDAGVIRIAGGRDVRTEAITGLLNRVQFVPTQHFARADAVERAYATAELSAFLLAWLHGITGRVINPPLPFALGGANFPIPTVAHMAATAGLPTCVWRASTRVDRRDTISPPAPTHAVVVFDGRLFGPIVPTSVQDGCRRLAILLGVPLLQVLLHHSREQGWRFVAVPAVVDFRIGGSGLARALARALGANPYRGVGHGVRL